MPSEGGGGGGKGRGVDHWCCAVLCSFPGGEERSVMDAGELKINIT